MHQNALLTGQNFKHICPETPKRSNFIDASSPQKHLKIYNLRKTNATPIKLTIIMYPHKKAEN